MMKRAAIYCRISADREGRELGVERQEQDGRALAERLGHVMAGIYIDNDISASTRSKKQRPQYRRMLANAAAGEFDTVIAYTSARLTRRPREHEDLIELAETHGIEYAYVRSPSFDLNTAAGRRVARILAATDAGEAEDIEERVRRQKLQAAQSGQWRGGRRPFGYEPDGVTVRRAEADEVLTASKAILVGRSVNGIVKYLNRRGVLTSAGSQWDSRALRRVLLRPRNAGLMEHDGQVIGAAEWDAIVPEDIWRGVVAVLGDPDRRTSPGPARRWRGSGLYICHCGATVYVHFSGGTRAGAHPAYTCSASKHMTRTASEVDALVGEVLVERLSRDDAVDLLAADTGESMGELLAAAATIRGELDALARQVGARQSTAAQMAIASAPLLAELESLEARVTVASRASVLDGLVGAEDVGAAWESFELDRKRAVIERLVTVTLLQSSKGRRSGWRPGESYFDPASVDISWRV